MMKRIEPAEPLTDKDMQPSVYASLARLCASTRKEGYISYVQLKFGKLICCATERLNPAL